jgi:ketosteroid isomerase-like protein
VAAARNCKGPPIVWAIMRIAILSSLLTVGLTCGVATLVQTPAPAGTSPAVTPSVPLPGELDRVLRDYEARFAARDAEGLSRLFVEDGWVLASGRTPVHGRANIAAHYASSGGPLTLRALAWSTDGTTGYIIGAYAWSAGSVDDGKFTLTLRKTGGQWLSVSDMDNGNRPR